MVSTSDLTPRILFLFFFFFVVVAGKGLESALRTPVCSGGEVLDCTLGMGSDFVLRKPSTPEVRFNLASDMNRWN